MYVSVYAHNQHIQIDSKKSTNICFFLFASREKKLYFPPFLAHWWMIFFYTQIFFQNEENCYYTCLPFIQTTKMIVSLIYNKFLNKMQRRKSRRRRRIIFIFHYRIPFFFEFNGWHYAWTNQFRSSLNRCFIFFFFK